MARALIAVGALLAALLGVAALLIGRSDDTRAVDNLLAERISLAAAAADRQERPLDLRRLARFGWDRLLVVARDTPRERISAALGSEWDGDIGFVTGDLLLFARGTRVARFADYRGEGRFAGLPRPIAELPRDAAVFRVKDLVMSPRSPGAARAPAGG